jgi:hypothetical protein
MLYKGARKFVPVALAAFIVTGMPFAWRTILSQLSSASTSSFSKRSFATVNLSVEPSAVTIEHGFTVLCI